MAKNKALVIALLERETTQVELARKIGIHDSRLSRIVNGHDEPTPEERKEIARILRKPVSELFPEAVAR